MTATETILLAVAVIGMVAFACALVWPSLATIDHLLRHPDDDLPRNRAYLAPPVVPSRRVLHGLKDGVARLARNPQSECVE